MSGKNKVIKIKELTLDKIHPSSVDDKFGGSKIVVIGKPGSGKSTMIKSILYAKRHIFPSGIVFSGTEDTNGFYSNFFPSTFIYNNYNLEVLQNFQKRQKKMGRRSKENKNLNPWSVCLIDDCTDDTKIFNHPDMVGMYKRGRHWNMLYILSLQYALDIKPNIRSNIDGVFLTKEPNKKIRKKLYDNYASMIPDFDTFSAIMDQVTENYTALYIDNTNKTNDWQDNVYWYKAEIPPEDFKFGSHEFWHWHYQKYNPNEGQMSTFV